jgi:hypothetical protein
MDLLSTSTGINANHVSCFFLTMLSASCTVLLEEDTRALKQWANKLLDQIGQIDTANLTGAFLCVVIRRWVRGDHTQLWHIIGKQSWDHANLAVRLTWLSAEDKYEYHMALICHGFVRWFAGAAGDNPFTGAEQVFENEYLPKWLPAAGESLQKIIVGSLPDKGKQDKSRLRCNDKRAIYLLTHVILPGTGYARDAAALKWFNQDFLGKVYSLLCVAFRFINATKDAWSTEEEAFLEVIISLMLLHHFSAHLYPLVSNFESTVLELRQTYESGQTQTTTTLHWPANDQEIHTCVLQNMFLETAHFCN